MVIDLFSSGDFSNTNNLSSRVNDINYKSFDFRFQIME